MSTAIGIRGQDFIGVGVGALIVDEDEKVLLLLRKNIPEAGSWTIPGGAVEWFETCPDAIVRECREELGVDVQIDAVLTVVDHIVKEDQRHWVSIEYLCSVIGGTPENRDRNENAEMQWFPLHALPAHLSKPTSEALACYRERMKIRVGVL